MAHVEPVVALLLSPVGTARQQAVNILLLDAGPDRRLDGAALPGGGHRSWVSDRGKRMSSVGQTYFDGRAALLERFADRPPARDRDIDWKFLRRTGAATQGSRWVRFSAR